MLYDRILVKYGELTIKGKNQKQFVDKLINTIKMKLKKFPKLTYSKQHQRFYIILNGEDYHEVSNQLQKVFGIHSFSLAAMCKSELEEIKQLALKVINQEITKPTTFKVETKRAEKSFPYPSLEVSRMIASHVLKNNDFLSVDVKRPEVTLRIEIRTEGTYIMTNEIFGQGGLPVGMDGKGVLMLSGGIDSPVAGYLIQKRGVAIDVVHYASPPYTSPQAKQKVIDLTEKIAHFASNSRINIHMVPFTKLQKAIYENCPQSYNITIMRRMMYRIAERVAKNIGALLITNGENVGQVASQTLQSMYVINEVTSMPVIRPVATMDKNEIIKIAKKIDTYEISILPYEDCCTIFVPQNPVTKPELSKCKQYEAAFDYETLINECVNNIELIEIKAGSKLELNATDEMTDLF